MDFIRDSPRTQNKQEFRRRLKTRATSGISVASLLSKTQLQFDFASVPMSLPDLSRAEEGLPSKSGPLEKLTQIIVHGQGRRFFRAFAGEGDNSSFSLSIASQDNLIRAYEVGFNMLLHFSPK